MARKPKAETPQVEPKPHGNAFVWTPEIEDEILGRIMRGDSIATICGDDRDDFTPGETTFYKRLASDADFAKRYAQAREAQAHREFDEIVSIADKARPDDVAVARLRIDARKWRAAKLMPKVYGDKQAVELTGKDGGPMEVKTLADFYADLTKPQPGSS